MGFFIFHVFDSCCFAQGISNNEALYSYKARKISHKLLIHNLRKNVSGFISTRVKKGLWNQYEVREFQDTYTRVMQALDSPDATFRFYTDDFGTLVDRHGIFNDEDYDNSWYDEKGNRITNEQYLSLSKKKQKKYHTFHATAQFVNYMIAVGDMVAKHEKEDYPLD